MSYNPFTAPALGPIVATPLTLPNWRAALANVRQKADDARIMCCGDSITYGSNSGILTALYAQSWVARLSALFNQSSLTPSQQAMAIPGLGNFRMAAGVVTTNNDNRWTATGTVWGNTTQGYGCASYACISADSGWSGSSGTLTFNPNATTAISCDTFDVYYLSISNSGTLSMTATGGSTVTQNTAGSAGVAKVSVAAASVSTSNTLAITSTDSTKTVYIIGIVPRLSSTYQVLLSNCGNDGQSTVTWTPGMSNPTSTNYYGAGLAGVYNPALISILLGSNDFVDFTLSPATLLANLQTMCTAFKTFCPNADLLIITPPPTTTTAYNTGLLSYLPVYYQIAGQFGASIFDLWSRYNGVYNHALEDGAQGGVHPNDLGYWDMANALFQLLYNA